MGSICLSRCYLQAVTTTYASFNVHVAGCSCFLVITDKHVALLPHNVQKPVASRRNKKYLWSRDYVCELLADAGLQLPTHHQQDN